MLCDSLNDFFILKKQFWLVFIVGKTLYEQLLVIGQLHQVFKIVTDLTLYGFQIVERPFL